MSNLKDRLLRNVRANLNHLLDNVRDFEERGGIRSIFDPDTVGPERDGFEEIGADGQSTRHAPPNVPEGQKTIRDFYANLEIPYGSDMETARQAYRRLMRKYHPDNYADDPEREAMATQLSQELSEAYQAVKSYLETGRY